MDRIKLLIPIKSTNLAKPSPPPPLITNIGQYQIPIFKSDNEKISKNIINTDQVDNAVISGKFVSFKNLLKVAVLHAYESLEHILELSYNTSFDLKLSLLQYSLEMRELFHKILLIHTFSLEFSSTIKDVYGELNKMDNLNNERIKFADNLYWRLLREVHCVPPINANDAIEIGLMGKYTNLLPLSITNIYRSSFSPFSSITTTTNNNNLPEEYERIMRMELLKMDTTNLQLSFLNNNLHIQYDSGFIGIFILWRNVVAVAVDNDHDGEEGGRLKWFLHALIHPNKTIQDKVCSMLQSRISSNSISNSPSPSPSSNSPSHSHSSDNSGLFRKIAHSLSIFNLMSELIQIYEDLVRLQQYHNYDIASSITDKGLSIQIRVWSDSNAILIKIVNNEKIMISYNFSNLSEESKRLTSMESKELPKRIIKKREIDKNYNHQIDQSNNDKNDKSRSNNSNNNNSNDIEDDRTWTIVNHYIKIKSRDLLNSLDYSSPLIDLNSHLEATEMNIEMNIENNENQNIENSLDNQNNLYPSSFSLKIVNLVGGDRMKIGVDPRTGRFYSTHPYDRKSIDKKRELNIFKQWPSQHFYYQSESNLWIHNRVPFISFFIEELLKSSSMTIVIKFRKNDNNDINSIPSTIKENFKDQMSNRIGSSQLIQKIDTGIPIKDWSSFSIDSYAEDIIKISLNNYLCFNNISYCNKIIVNDSISLVQVYNYDIEYIPQSLFDYFIEINLENGSIWIKTPNNLICEIPNLNCIQDNLRRQSTFS